MILYVFIRILLRLLDKENSYYMNIYEIELVSQYSVNPFGTYTYTKYLYGQNKTFPL